MNALIARACSAWLCLVTFIVTVTGGCVDSPLPDALPLARVIVAWDVRRCDARVRVHVELEDEAGAQVDASAPCAIGQVTFDVDTWGIYLARVTGEVQGERRSEQEMRCDVDAPIARFVVATPG